ncbi:MAG: hypothetical protein FWF91_02215 [Coriobacteriia bacterium]|nr:hypothetical protein [Coriobacteriia bacterium]
MAIVMVFGTAGVLAACGKSNGQAPPQPSAVKEIKTGKQVSGNVTFTNYSVIITAETDWAAMSESDKQKVIDYAFSEVYRLNAENDVRNYNVIGTTETGEGLFILDHDNHNVVIYANGSKAGTLEIPENKAKAATTPATTPATTTPEPEDQGADDGEGEDG